MKNRKIIVTAFVLIAALMLGIGYAALSDTLTIIGNAHIDIDKANQTFDTKVYFDGSAAVSSTGTGTAEDVASHTADDATFTANKLALVGEKSVFTFIIQNDSNVPAKISVESTKLSGDTNPSNSNTDKFTVEYAYSRDDMTIPSGESMTVTVTVTVKEAIITATSATFGIELTATAIEG